MNKIYWLASYPKSGNTWVRIFLANYLREKEVPADINHLEGAGIASDRDLFERWAGVDSSDLSADAIADLRPAVYQQVALHIEHPVYLKVHDACTRNSEGDLLFPPAVTGGVVYLIRNPLDVAVSYAHHGGRTVEDAVGRLCGVNSRLYEATERLGDQLPQRLLSWSAHVRSWVDQAGMRVTVVRYEDILAEPEASFSTILEALDLELEPERLARAIEHSRFERMQDQERRMGFRERPLRADAPFFRRGQAGTWRTELSPELARKIVEAHGEVMRRYGYQDKNGALVF